MASKVRDQAHADALEAIRDTVGPDKALLLAHLRLAACLECANLRA